MLTLANWQHWLRRSTSTIKVATQMATKWLQLGKTGNICEHGDALKAFLTGWTRWTGFGTGKAKLRCLFCSKLKTPEG
jgi:hypothetical protein